MRTIVTKKYTRVRKDMARRLFNEGKTIYLTPSNVVANDSNFGFRPYPIVSRNEENFDNIINRFEYYNCNYKMGYYTIFWIKTTS